MNEKELEFRDMRREIIEEAYHKFCKYHDVISAMESWIQKTALPYDRKYPGATKIVTPQVSLQDQIYNFISGRFGWGQKTFDDIQAAIDAVHNPHPGGLVWIQEGLYQPGSTLKIWNGTKSLTLAGAAGYGKSDQNFGTMVKVNFSPLLQIEATDDARSAYGISFRDIKFVGPGTSTSIGLDLPNTDTGSIEHCTFLKFGTSVKVRYQGSTFPLGEQPGKIFIHDSEFAEGQNDYIFLDKCTQIYIHDCCFESFGPFYRAIHIKDSNKAHIGRCEFNVNDEAVTMTEFIRVESVAGGNYIPNQILISDNWAYRKVKDYVFVRTVGTSDIYNVVSKDNIIHQGFDPFTSPVDTTGPYVPVHYDDISADDYILPPSMQCRNETSRLPSNQLHRNLWSHCLFTLIGDLPDKDGDIYVKVCRTGVVLDLATIAHFNVPRVVDTQSVSPTDPHSHPLVFENARATISFLIPTLWYFRVQSSGTANQQALYGMYK